MSHRLPILVSVLAIGPAWCLSEGIDDEGWAAREARRVCKPPGWDRSR